MTAGRLLRSFLAAAVLLVPGCRARHLGSDTGVAYRTAIADQRDSAADAAAFDADAAKAAMETRRTGASRGTRAPVAPLTVPGTAPASTAGAWPGASGAMVVEAK